MVVTDDGRLRTGLVIEESDDEIRLLPNLLKPDKIETISKFVLAADHVTNLGSSQPFSFIWTLEHHHQGIDLKSWLQTVGPIGENLARTFFRNLFKDL